MRFEIESTDSASKHLNQQARIRFEEAVVEYAQDLIDEAGRLESATRSVDGLPEITSSMVNDANILLRRMYPHTRRGKTRTVAQLVSTLGALATGLIFQGSPTPGTGAFAWLIVVLVVTVVATVVAVMRE